MSELRMPTINQVALAGRMVQDPEFRITDGGTARLTARIAVNRAWRDRNDEWQEDTSFFNIVLWNRLAERLSDRLRKGSPVFVSGRLRSYSWRDDDENPHYLVEIQARSLQILERLADGANGADAEDIDVEGEGDAEEAEETDKLELAA